MGESKGSVCSKCGGKICCEYIGDLGTVDHSFTWKHTCTRCSHRENFEAFGCAGYTTPEELAKTICPGCGQIAKNQTF